MLYYSTLMDIATLPARYSRFGCIGEVAKCHERKQTQIQKAPSNWRFTARIKLVETAIGEIKKGFHV
jgi:hypothetical protein